ncbi:MAG: SufD family Fe-S cluster assembly protein [Candidatus Dependentiae bacterium]|nr:SufD family Fe-S cluster assembly protein [Candidatus Dependentiae bacterium]
MINPIKNPSSLFFGSTTDFIGLHPDIGLRVFGKSRTGDYDYIVYVPAHIHQETPLTINTYVSPETDPLSTAKKTLVIIDNGSSIYIHDKSHSNNPNPTQITAEIEYWIGDYANLELLYDQELPLTAHTSVAMNFYVARHSLATINCLISGGSHSSVTLNLHAQGERSHIQVRGAYILNGSQQACITIYQNHSTSHTQSDVIIKGVLADNAQSEYKGLICIAKDAPYTDAVQENKNLLIGEQCRALSQPSLEILNNEVRCAHGSAVGQIDNDLLFYIQSRGIPTDQATLLLTEGFIAGLFDGEVYTLARNRINTILS